MCGTIIIKMHSCYNVRKRASGVFMKKKFIIGGVFLAMVIAGLAVLRVGNGRDDGSLSLSGNVEVTEVNVGFEVPGRVLTLFTDEGRAVKTGDKLAMLDSAEYDSQVAQNRAALSNAGAQLDKAQKDLERANMLFKQDAISTQQMEAAKTAYDVALAQVRQARAMLRTSEVKTRDTVIYAPMQGIVLGKNVEAGETVGAGIPVFTIGDLEKPWIRVYVKEDKLGLVKLGQKAQVRTDSYPGKIYEGTVTYISSEAEFTPKNVQTQEERVKLVFGVKVSVKNVSNELKPGMPADVRILVKP
jgi:HlyD family secretion protein